MKICQLAAVDFGLYHFLLPLMESMRSRGHDVVGVCSKGELAGKVEDKGFRVEHIDFKRNHNLVSHLKAYGQLVKLFRRERFDIVHVHSPIAALIGRLAAARVGGTRIVYTAHGFYFHENQPWLARSLFVALEWIGGHFTDVLFTQSQEDAETARRLGLCRGKAIEAIGNGVDPGKFHRPAADGRDRYTIRRELETAQKDVVILMVGRLVAEKGYIELFEAMNNVDGRLWVVGARLESDHAKSITDAVHMIKSSPDLSNRISFLGYRSDVDRLMRAADIFTLPSHREGMPRSIIEAMMTGLPVVATNIRGSREEVVDGETGFLVPVRNAEALAQALNRLVRDPGLRGEMGSRGAARACLMYDEKTVIDRQLKVLGLVPDQSR